MVVVVEGYCRGLKELIVSFLDVGGYISYVFDAGLMITVWNSFLRVFRHPFLFLLSVHPPPLTHSL